MQVQKGTVWIFVDADWATNSTDRRSSFESVKLKTVALRSMEAEYMALSEATKEAFYYYFFNDNRSALYLAANAAYHKRSKHIDIRQHFVRDAISSNLIKVGHLRTDEMPADILTKGLDSKKHYVHLERLRLYQ